MSYLQQPKTVQKCFLCNPEKSRVVFESENFYALLGLGPVIEGYLVLVSKKHHKSMVDLPRKLKNEYLDFKKRIRQIATKEYGSVLITEHGRIPFCSFDKNGHDPHCYHAHQLVFPVNLDLHDSMIKYGLNPTKLNSFYDVEKVIRNDDEYLFFEDNDGEICISPAINVQRQFFRFLVAEKTSALHTVDWKIYQGYDRIFSAKDRYSKHVLT